MFKFFSFSCEQRGSMETAFRAKVFNETQSLLYLVAFLSIFYPAERYLKQALEILQVLISFKTNFFLHTQMLRCRA